MAGTDAAGPDLDDLGRFTPTLAAGEFVFREGDTGTDVCIVRDGHVDLLAAGDRVLTTIGSGGIFGESALFEDGPRDVSARAATEVRLIRLDRAAFDRVVAEAPQVAVAMLQQTARHLATLRAQSRTTADREGDPVAAGGDPRLVAAETGEEFPIADLDAAIVGRRDASAGFVPAIDLTALDGQRTLSRQHATLARRGDRVFVREARGRNGTFVNGSRLAADDEIELRDGDQVQFGVVRTVYRGAPRGGLA